MIFIFLGLLLGYTVDIVETDNSRGEINILSEYNDQLYFIRFRNNVMISESEVKRVKRDLGGYTVVLRAINRSMSIKYLKNLSKSFEYDYDLEVGTKIIIMSYKNGVFSKQTEVYDWCPIPDLSTAFVSFSLCGILLSFIIKVYLD